MNITPRKNEVAAVVELLESDEFDSADKLAKAIIKATWTQLLERDMSVLALEVGSGLVVAYGPFSGEGEALKFHRTIPFPSPMRIQVKTLCSPLRQLQRSEQVENGVAQTFCADERCLHPVGTHEHKQFSGCVVKGCPCKSLRLK